MHIESHPGWTNHILQVLKIDRPWCSKLDLQNSLAVEHCLECQLYYFAWFSYYILRGWSQSESLGKGLFLN